MEYPSGLDELDGLLWQAGRTHVIPHREDPDLLERLRDPRALARARELLASSDPHVRDWAIVAIERIGFALGDQETAELLLRQASSAKGTDEVAVALEALERLTPPRPLLGKPLAELIRDPRWRVWHQAVRCAHLAPADDVEPALLERLNADRYGLVYVAYELRYLRSDESLQALDRLFEEAPDLDVRTSAFQSLAARLGRRALPYARQLARGRRIEQKLAAEAWLSDHGEISDVPFMAKRLKRLITARRVPTYLPPEVSLLVPFLLRFRDVPEAANALEAVRADHTPLREPNGAGSKRTCHISLQKTWSRGSIPQWRT
jgi:hypothetical protein